MAIAKQFSTLVLLVTQPPVGLVAQAQALAEEVWIPGSTEERDDLRFIELDLFSGRAILRNLETLGLSNQATTAIAFDLAMELGRGVQKLVREYFPQAIALTIVNGVVREPGSFSERSETIFSSQVLGPHWSGEFDLPVE